MKKKIIALVLCIFCAFLFVGCSTSPGYEIRQNEDNSVTETIFVPYSPSELRALGVDDESAILAINTHIYSKVKELYSEYDNNFQMRLSTDPNLSQKDKEYLSTAITYHIASSNESNQVLQANVYTNGIEFYVEYDSVVAYYYYKYNLYYEEMLKELEKDDSVVQKSFFINKKISTNSNMYGTGQNPLALQFQNTVRDALGFYTNLSEEVIESLVPTEFVYSYAVPTKKLYSDADVVYTQDGITYHQWTISQNNLDRKLTTWTLQVNRNAWYVVILGAGIVFAGVMMIVSHIVSKKKKSKKDENQISPLM